MPYLEFGHDEIEDIVAELESKGSVNKTNHDMLGYFGFDFAFEYDPAVPDVLNWYSDTGKARITLDTEQQHRLLAVFAKLKEELYAA